MKKTARRALALLLCLVMCLGMLPAGIVSAAEPEQVAIPIYEDTSYSFEERAADLVARMTLKQKGSQLVEGSPAIPASQLGGGALKTPATKDIARYSWWAEALHGLLRDNMNPQSEGTKDNVSYAQSLTMGSTWNPDLYYEGAIAIADECRERSIKNSLGNALNINFYSPTVNMQRDPRWGRNEEAYSEDVYLNSIMGAAFVNGMEGKDREGNVIDPSGYIKTHTTIKHYTANNTEAIRTSGGATSDLRALREYYTAPYRNVIRMADVSSVMTAYSSFNSEPCSYSSYLMDTLLRQTFGFTGYITSDCDSAKTISNLNYTNPRTGKKLTSVEQMAGALAHGEDLECNSGISASVGDYNAQSQGMVDAGVQTDKGTFTENSIDVSVHRLMTARIATGEFDENNPYTIAANQRMADQKANGTNNYTPERIALVDREVEEGVVMLKNDGILPLNIPASGAYKVVIVGSWQTDMYLGLYSSEQRHAEDDKWRINIQKGITNAIKEVNPNATFTYITSTSLNSSNEEAIRAADVAIVVTGTGSNYSSEGRDRSSTALNNNQATLISNVGKLNANTVAVMETCGPMEVKTFENDVKAILWSSYGGIRKGVGFGKVLTGAVNPSGHLTATWYKNDSDIPGIRDYNLYATNGSNGRTYMYYVGANAPSYVFGHGLSYTTFAYSNLKIDKSAYDANDTVKVSFNVKNTGKVAGKDVAQLYIAQPNAPKELNRPIRRLEGFQKVDLQPGETKTVTLEVKIPDLAYYNEAKDCYEVDTGAYQVQVGEDSAHANLIADFTVSGAMDEYPVLLTVKANQEGDEALGIEERIIYDRGAIVNPQLTVAMNNEKLYGYIIKEQTSIIKSLKSCPLPEGMTFEYSSNRPNVAKVENGVIKTVGPGVATITVTGTLDGVTVTDDFVVYVMANAKVDGINVNGEPLAKFNPDKHSYKMTLESKKIPEVTAFAKEGLIVNVEPATALPGTTTITCTDPSAGISEVYTIDFKVKATSSQTVAIDFTNPDDAAKFDIINDTGIAIQSGKGLTLTATRPAFETCNGQNSGDQATTPEDVVTIPVAGDWTATLEFDFSTGSANNGYYQFFGFYASEGDDYQNLAGIRGGDGALQNFLRTDGNITADSSDLNSTPGLASAGTYWFQIIKEGDTYTCLRSSDGDEFTEMFSYEATGIEADSIVIDAYTGMTAGYQFTLKNLDVEVVGGGLPNIDFTNPEDAAKFDVVNEKNAAIAEGKGLTLTATRPAFETCNGQNSGDQATNPEDVIVVPVAGDWTATLEFDFSEGSARNGYYQFFGFYASEGDDFQNLAGIRGGDGALQNFLRTDGNITADSSDLNSAPGLASAGTYWFQIVKEGDTYTCLRSSDGDDFTEMFAYEATGIEADSIVIDAYTGMTEGYQFTLKSLEFEGGSSAPVVKENPAIASITVNGEDFGFDPAVSIYNFEVAKDSAKAPVIAAVAANKSTQIAIEQLDGPFGTAYVTGTVDNKSVKYSLSFNYGPQDDYFADGDMSDDWTILHEVKDPTPERPWTYYRFEEGTGLVMPTQKGSIYMAKQADPQGPWTNMFTMPAQGNWEVIIKSFYPQLPKDIYQQTQVLAWQDEDHYIRINCQYNAQHNLRVEPANEVGSGTFNILDVTYANPNPDNTATLYYKINKNGTTYTVSYSTDCKNWVAGGSVSGLDYVDPKIGIFCTQDDGNNNYIELAFEYIAVTSLNGVEQKNGIEVLNWAAQNVADYIAAGLPTETAEKLSYKAPHGYEVAFVSSNADVISANGTVTPAAADTKVQVAVQVTEGDITVTSEPVTITVKGTELPHEHKYTAKVTAPTCTEKGFTTYTCECGDTYTADEVAALGHDYKNGVCTRCGEKDPNYKPEGNYVLAQTIEAGKTYVIVAAGKYALNNKAVSYNNQNTLGSSAVTVEDGVITSEVTEDMLWTIQDVAEGTSAAVDGAVQYNIYDQAGNILYRTSGSSGTAPLTCSSVAPSKPNYATWSFAERNAAAAEFTMYSNSPSDSDYPFTMTGYEAAFNCPGTARSSWDPLTYGDPIQLYELAAPAGLPNIDFTDSASADLFEIVNKDTAAIVDGKGLTLVATKQAFEDANEQLEGDAATTPKDLVLVPVNGNWTATLEVDFSTGSASNGYYQFFGFYAMDDYNNCAGIRGGDGAMQDFIRKGGAISHETMSSEPGFADQTTYWLRIEKDGTTYTCYRSADGKDFTEMFSYADTGIEAESIAIDAYTGMTEGYQFTLKSLTFEGGSTVGCDHNYVAVVTPPTCTEKGFTTYTCSKCGKVRVGDETPALRHNFVDGVCTRCGALEDEIDPSIPIFENPQYTFAERAADLVARLTPAQKGNQVVSNSSAVSASQMGGGALNVPATKNLNAYHWWSECLHGYSANIGGSGDTGNSISYTQNTGVGNSWNPELYYQEATMISDEIRERANKNSQTGNCIDLNFYSPTVNMHRDPRWGRNEESFSEDVLLNSVMASAFVCGVEGKDMEGNILDPDGYKKAMCTVKHYVANNSERNRLNGGAQTSLRALREYYTAPYRNVIQTADVSSVMTAYSTLNGEPSSYSSYLMDTLLRQTFGFSGHITSDCDSVATETRHSYQNPFTGATMTDLEALAGSLAHGEDLECTGGYSGFGTYGSKMTRILEAAPETDKGIFTENALDIAAHRLLTARISTGEFDANLRYTQEATARINAGNRNAARLAMNDEMNKESVVMLQNKGVLPLQIPKTGSDYTVVIVGSWQTNSYRGLYTGGGSNSVYNIQSGIRDAIQRVNPNVNIVTITSDSLNDSNRATISAADAAIVVTGTPENYSKEDGDRTSTVLPNNLESLISSVGKLNPNTVCIMETCGPMRVTQFQNDVNAILWNSFGGLRKGSGFGAVITGEVNPSGKVTDTWYQNVSDSGTSDIPSIYDYDLFPSEGKNGRTYMYYNGKNAPSYPFGFGLSYTTFAYSNLKINKTAFDANDTIEVSFDVKNTGKVAGKEVTQLYIAQPNAPAALKRPIRRLEGFDKIELQPGETKTVEMTVSIEDLAFYNEDKDCYEVDTGAYQVQVGTNSAAANLTADFTVSGELKEYPVLLTVKANQRGDTENGIEERLIYDKNQYVNPQLTVAMNNEKLYGYIIANQQSPVKKMKSCPLPEGMTFTYSSNRPSVAKVEDGKIKTVGAGVATITVNGTLDGVTVTADFVVYVMGNSYLENITLDGKSLAGYARDKHGYELSAADFTKVPVVAAVNEDPDLKVTVTQFTGIPGYATVVADCASTNQHDEYRIGIGNAPVATDFAKGWADAQTKNWTVSNGDANASFGANGLTIKGQAGTIAAGTAKNVYAEPAFGEWVAQTDLSLAAVPANGQSAGMIVLDTAENNVQLVYEGGSTRYLTAYSYVDGTRTQVGRVTVSDAATNLSLQTVKQGSVYTFRYSFDGENWNDMAGKATVQMGYPQVGVLALGDGVEATFDGIDVFKITELYPRLASITVDGKPLGEFDPEVFVYSCEVSADGTEIPVVAATAADADLRVVVEQPAARFGVATVNVYSGASSATYTLRFNRGPENEYFADGEFDANTWTVLRENKNTYSVQQGKGLVLPTQQADIYSTGAAWENCFVEPGMGNWVVVAKMVYPKVPTADYQQAMLLVWEDEDNYIRMNCQQSQLRMEPGVETAGSFNGNLGSGNASAAADGTVTVYYMIEKNGNDYSVGYSQNGTSFQILGTARNIAYNNPQIGLFATQNSSNTPIDAYFEYVYVAARNGLRPSYDEMLNWAAQNAADYISDAIPAEATDKITLPAAPHGYTVTLNSSNETVIAPDGSVHPGANDKIVKLSVTVSEGDVSATSAEINVKVPGTEGGCDHAYTTSVVAPTCTEAGYTLHTCSNCGDEYKTDEVAALGHNWDKGVITKPATATAAGVKTFTCSRCGETRTEEIPALGGSVSYVLADTIEAGKQYVIVSNGYALTNKVAEVSTAYGGTSLASTRVTVENNAIVSDVTADMIWDFGVGTSTSNNGYETGYFLTNAGGKFLSRNGPTNENPAPLNTQTYDASNYTTKPQYCYWVVKDLDEEGNKAVFVTGTGEWSFALRGAAEGFDAPGNADAETVAAENPVKLYEVVAAPAGTAIDFTNPADASKFDVINDTGIAIVEGNGLTLTATRPAFEDCNGQNTDDQATTPENVVVVPVNGNWEATLKFDFNAAADNGYYQFFGFYAGEGDDYQNLAGIRGGDGAMQNFLRVDGAITADSEELNSTPGLATNGTYWYKLVKDGDTYTCLRSADGEEFTEMFSYADTGIEADRLLIDAYTGMTEGYQFTLKNLDIVPAGGEAPHKHDYKAVVTAPTCTEKGYTTYTCECGKSYVADEVAALGHDLKETTVAATCTKAGSVTTTCSRCDYKKVVEIPALGHDLSAVTVEATCTEAGSITETCARCDYEKVTEIPTLGHDYLNGICQRCGDVEIIEGFFEDVLAGTFCFDAVKWAVDNKITNGVDDGIFAPSHTVTRAQIVTFLWRAAGCPEPTGTANFVDLKEGAFYTKAVAWAVENEITNGVGKNKFAPESVCTRGQIVTFLWRYLGKPEATKPATFSDLDEGAFYVDAVAWAVEAGITTGITEELFKPENDCTRAQAVTFLYRAVAK